MLDLKIFATRIKPAIRIYTQYFISSSLFYFALRMWRRHLDFIPEIENNSMVVEILMFFLTGVLLAINLRQDNRTKTNFVVYICLVLFLAVSYVLYWNAYSWLMWPRWEPWYSFDFFTGFFVVGVFVMASIFVLEKVFNRINENYRQRN